MCNKPYLFYFLLVILLLTCGFSNAIKIRTENEKQVSDSNISDDINQEEIIEIYGINAFTGSGDQKTETKPYGDHGIRISQRYGYGKAEYEVALECSNEGVENDIIQIGALYKNIINPGSFSVFNVNTQEFDSIVDPLGDEKMDDFVQFWSEDLSFESYVEVESDGDEIVRFQFECDGWPTGEDVIIDSVYVRYTDKQEIMQQYVPSDNTKFNGDFNAVKEKQSFIPVDDFKNLKRVKLLFYPKENNPQGVPSFDFDIKAVFINSKNNEEQTATISRFRSKTVNFYNYNKATGPCKWLDIEIDDVELMPTVNVPSDVVVKYYLSINKGTSNEFAWCYSGSYQDREYFYKLYGTSDSSSYEEIPNVSPKKLIFTNIGNDLIKIKNEGNDGSCVWWKATVNNQYDFLKINEKNTVSGVVYKKSEYDLFADLLIGVDDISELERGENDLGSPISITFGNENGVIENIDISVTVAIGKHSLTSAYSEIFSLFINKFPFFQNLIKF